MAKLSEIFNLPVHAEGNKLVEETGNVCATFNLPNEAHNAAKAINAQAELEEMQEQALACCWLEPSSITYVNIMQGSQRIERWQVTRQQADLIYTRVGLTMDKEYEFEQNKHLETLIASLRKKVRRGKR